MQPVAPTANHLPDLRLAAGARVAVAMSGGVDSSVVAGLLHEAGYVVVGLTARLYDVDPALTPRSGTCCAPEDARDARQVAWTLGIRHYVLDERDSFRREVIDRFIREYDQGDTPNPCVACNRSLKFGALVAMARALGCAALATGHYARLELDGDGDPHLRRAVDPGKDQAYFLHPLQPEGARFLRFPLGGMTKTEVRAHAERLGLPVAHKAESMDVCFVGAQSAQAFVERQAGARPGPMVDLAGTTLAQHAGVAGYAVGQRHGLGLGGGEPRYVVDKRSDGTVVVGSRADLQVRTLRLDGCTWVGGRAPSVGTALLVQVRHRGHAVPARVEHASGDQLELTVDGLLLGAGRGQSGVLLAGDEVLGGGRIVAVTSGASREAA
jgi:tRNA-specific 2-thiouridylase